MEVTDIVQYGGVGLAALSMWIVYKLSGNHIEHNTEATKNLSVVIAELKEFLQHKKGR